MECPFTNLRMQLQLVFGTKITKFYCPEFRGVLSKLFNLLYNYAASEKTMITFCISTVITNNVLNTSKALL